MQQQSRRSMLQSITLITFAFMATALLPAQTVTKIDVLTQHNDLARTGANLGEKLLTPTSVSGGHFGLLFKHDMDDQLYTQPLYAAGVEVGGGTHDVVYVTTVSNSVYAFDANDAAATAPLWHVNFGTPANLHDAPFGCTDINGTMGIIGTPVIDRIAGAIYVVALTRAGGSFMQRLHALDLSTGADLPGSPVEIKADGFNPLMQNQRPGLLLANGMVYIGYASHCDKEPYHGYLLAYDAKTLQQTAVLNTSPTGEGASIWQSGQAPAADSAGHVYVVTGNGSWDGKSNLSESFLKLDAHLKLLDWFTPSDHEKLDADDNDLNSSGATLVPGAAAGSELVLGGGKTGMLYTIDASHFGNLGDEHALQHFKATSSHLHSLVYWKSEKNGQLLYVWGQRDKARVYRLRGNQLDESPVQTRPEANEGHPGAMLSLSANGDRDGILWAAIHATGDSWHESRPGILHAYDADDINHELWNSWQNKSRDNCGNYSKMSPPTIANGKVFLASFGTENTGTGSLCVYGLLPDGQVPATPSHLEATVKDGVVTVGWTAVNGATYRLMAQTKEDGSTRVLAAGLTDNRFIQAVPLPGSTLYSVIAVNENGASPVSELASLPPVPSEARHPMH